VWKKKSDMYHVYLCMYEYLYEYMYVTREDVACLNVCCVAYVHNAYFFFSFHTYLQNVQHNMYEYVYEYMYEYMYVTREDVACLSVCGSVCGVAHSGGICGKEQNADIYDITLQHTATHCNTLQHSVTLWSTSTGEYICTHI